MTATQTATAEALWLLRYPWFEERPASITEFLGPDYLNLGSTVRPRIREILVDLFGAEVNPHRISVYEEAISTGAIGVGKTTLASIVIPYMVHWTMCLHNPQEFYGMMPGTRIAFMMMSTSRLQARDVVFSDIQARIDASPWFQRPERMYDTKIRSQFRFPSKDVWIIPGDSSERTFEGFNILGGILDEVDSHKVTKNKDYAEIGFTTIHGRMTSRFQDRGFILIIGQMKKSVGFASRTYSRLRADPKGYAVRMSIWESFGWKHYLRPDGTHDSFWFDTERMCVTTEALARLAGFPETIMEIPEVYKKDFLASPYKALRDLAGRPPAVTSPLFNDATRINTARDTWRTAWNHAEGPADHRNRLQDWFVARNSIKRVIHVDIAYSAEGDALGLAMGHVPELIEVEGEMKPFVMIDLILRMKGAPGQELFLGDVRRVIYDLIDHRHFNVKLLTTDGFQSTDFRQQIAKRRIKTDVVSTDKTALPYYDLYDALSEDRIGIPPYIVPLNPVDPQMTDILYVELSQLQEENGKIDHLPEGSKDVADAVACVCSNLMGDRKYRAAPSNTGGDHSQPARQGAPNWPSHPAMMNPQAPHAPIPPQTGGSWGQPAPWRPR